jgi:PIN domain nuclease of toxin-antitoxin system
MADRPFLIDTHVWLWWEDGRPGRLSAEVRREISAAEHRAGLWIAAMTVWEVAMLESKRRVDVVPDALTWMQRLFTRPDRVLVPMTPEIAVASTRLPEAPVADPVDRILLATARIENLTLVTADRKLIDYGKRGHVKVLPV